MEPEKNEELTGQEEQKPFVPASKRKRVAAWIGVIFMVILIILYTYSLATGAFLNW